MGGGHRAGQRLDQRGGFARRLRLSLDPLRQAAALHPFEGKKRPSSRLLHLEDLHNVGMLQPRDGLRLATEAREIGGVGAAQHLQRNRPPQLAVPGFVDHAHAAAGDLAENRIIGQLRGNAGFSRGAA
jgi:hypothetical protein